MSALKKNREEQGGAYVGALAKPTPPQIPVLLSQLTFFQWIHRIFSDLEQLGECRI